MQAATEERKRPGERVGLCGSRQRLKNVCVDEKACVCNVSEKKMSIWTSWPVQAATENRKRLCGRVSLRGYVNEKKMSLSTSWPV